MKKIVLFLCITFMLFGCGKEKDSNIIKELKNKVESSKNYQMTATLDIKRNEDTYSYEVISTYQKDNYFKVQLINKQNNHEQIILKDNESVYVVTPALNKSFKFQSDWPYNNSQIYLLQPIITDLESDSERKIETNDDGYIIESKVNYSNEKSLKKQKVYLDKNKEIIKVEVLDEVDNIKMTLKIISIEYDKKMEDDYFNINKYYKEVENKEKEETTSNIDSIVYPMYVPSETYLTSQDITQTENGERVILTFSGESGFVLVQENLSNSNIENYVYGDPYLILDTVGSITDTSVSWISNGVEYSILSDSLTQEELLTVAQSIATQPIAK